MIINTIKTIGLSTALAACPVSPSQPTVHARSSLVVPVGTWPPESREYPEGTHPPHGEGSGDSPLFEGMTSYLNLNVTNTSAMHVTVDSGASGTSHTYYASVTWLQNSPTLIVESRDFPVVEPVVTTSQTSLILEKAPNSTKHRSNPSIIKWQRSLTRR